MSNSLLSTISIILSEVVILLIGVIVFLFIKNRNKTLSISDNSNSNKNNIKETILCLEKLAKITETRLKNLGSNNEKTEVHALTKRLSFIHSEINLLKNHDLNNNGENYWSMVNKAYHDSEEEYNSDKIPSKKEAVYQSRIDNLEDFKEMFYDAEKRVIKSNITINELRNLLEEKTPPDAQTLIDKINEIERENKILCEKIQQADEALAKKISDINDNDENSELDSLKEENEFLVVQIQHLLEQEVKASNKMLDDINSLEEALSEKNNECKKLSEQLTNNS